MNSKIVNSKDLMKNNSKYFHLLRRQKDVSIDPQLTKRNDINKTSVFILMLVNSLQ